MLGKTMARLHRSGRSLSMLTLLGDCPSCNWRRLACAGEHSTYRRVACAVDDIDAAVAGLQARDARPGA
jgi:hypothetical protein